MKTVIYEGIFFDGLSFAGRLPKKVAYKHLTTAFRPSTASSHLYGEQVAVLVTGYGNDGDNEGYKVVFIDGSEEIKRKIENLPVPHITLSTSLSGKPVNTAKLSFDESYFDDYPYDFVLYGKFGGFVSENGGPAHPYFGD